MKCHIKKLPTFLMIYGLLLLADVHAHAATNQHLSFADAVSVGAAGPLPAGSRVPCASGPAVPNDELADELADERADELAGKLAAVGPGKLAAVGPGEQAGQQAGQQAGGWPGSQKSEQTGEQTGEWVGAQPDALPAGLDESTRLDMYCLRASYPEIAGIAMDDSGLWLLMKDGGRVLYAQHASSGAAGGNTGLASAYSGNDGLGSTGLGSTGLGNAYSGAGGKSWVVDVRSSMADVYPLEPERPDTPYGVSPGRRRSHDFLGALYGHNASQVSRQVRQTTLLGQPLGLSTPAARALALADARLAAVVSEKSHLKDYLKVDGGFVWRRIAGETRLSPHAYGIAVDLSPRLAPYWRWSKLRPHPMQRGYPSAIVDAMEQAGFIWGGKWHEYDIMHFEYRPEIICNSRMLHGRHR